VTRGPNLLSGDLTDLPGLCIFDEGIPEPRGWVGVSISVEGARKLPGTDTYPVIPFVRTVFIMLTPLKVEQGFGFYSDGLNY